MDITALLAGLPSDIASRLQTADTGGASFAQAFATASGNSEAISSEAIAADLLAETLPAANREQLSALITQSGNPVPLSDNAPEQISEESGGDEALFAIATMAAPTTAALVTQPATPALTTASGVAGTHLSEPSSAAVANLRSEPRANLPQDEAVPLPTTDTQAAATPTNSTAATTTAAATRADRQLLELASTEATAVRATAVVEVPPPTAPPAAPAASSPAAMAQSVPSSISPSLQSPVASASWGRELEHQVLGLAQRGDDRVDLQLNPRELGPLSVSLTLDDQGARVQFFSAHAAVRSAVEQAIPQLRDALAQQGIALGEASVGEQQQQQHQQRTPEWDYRGGDTGDSDSKLEMTSVAPTASDHIRGVDLYA